MCVESHGKYLTPIWGGCQENNLKKSLTRVKKYEILKP